MDLVLAFRVGTKCQLSIREYFSARINHDPPAETGVGHTQSLMNVGCAKQLIVCTAPPFRNVSGNESSISRLRSLVSCSAYCCTASALLR